MGIRTRTPAPMSRRERADRRRLVIGLVVALAIAVFVEVRTRQADVLRHRWGDTTLVWQATVDIEPSERLADGRLRSIEVPASAAPTAAVAVDAESVAARFVPAGAILTAADTDASTTGPRAGMRWAAIPIDPTVAPGLRAGDIVDLVASDPFGGPSTVIAVAVEVVELRDESLVVELASADAADVAGHVSAGAIVPVLAGR